MSKASTVDELAEHDMDIKNAEVELSLAEDQLAVLKAEKADSKKVVPRSWH